MDVKSNCIGCGACVTVCPTGAIDPQGFDVNRKLCISCGKCTEVCYARAKKITGEEYTVPQLMKIIERDRVFYQNSGGGVTIGGGEPCMQAEFATELLTACQHTNIHTAIETCGYGSWEIIKPMFEHCDQIFFDLKCMDPVRHKEMTGVDNELILSNATKMAELGKEAIFRIPLIPGCNDDEENIHATGEFVRDIYHDDISPAIEILPYHDFGKGKYRWLDQKYSLSQTDRPAEEKVRAYEQLLRDMGIKVKVHGQ